MPSDVDLLIVGGGCAGLSLAMQLTRFDERIPKTLILEQRALRKRSDLVFLGRRKHALRLACSPPMARCERCQFR
jgi:2-polyprenyl-6-methoxyphenol hydroxylase-like FAD-dependent oxidoreductase